MSERKIKLILESLSAEAGAALADRPLPADLTKPQFRRMNRAIEKAGYDADAHTVTLSISSEFPVERYDGTEILVHTPAAVDTSRLENGISHLFNHDWNVLLGRTQSYTIQNKKLSVVSRFGSSATAKEKEQDVADGIMPDVSLGYFILKVEVTEDKNGNRTYNVVRWMPYEWSSVTVPADYTVGLERSASPVADVEVVFRRLQDDPAPEATRSADIPAETVSAPAPVEQTRSMAADPDDEDDDEDDPEDEDERAASIETTSTTTQPTEQRTQTMATAAVVADPQREQKDRVDGLRALMTQFPQHFGAERFADAVANGTTVRDAKDVIAEAVIAGAQGSSVRTASTEVLNNMSEREQRTYSRAGAARAAINLLRKGTFDDAETGFAVEVSDSIRKLAQERGVSGLGSGILTPGVTNARFAAMEAQRTIQSGSGSVATATNFTDVMVPPIELLRARTMVLALGARMIPGLHGTPQFTRQNAAASSSWLAEGASVTATDPGLDFFTMAPHRLSMASAYTRDFLALSNLAIDSFLAEDRNAVLARSLDYACLAGSGTGNVPMGLINRTGLATVLTGTTRAANGTVTAGAGGVPPTYIDINAYESTISTANGNIGTLGWLSSPKMRAVMRSIPKIPSASNGETIMPDSKVGANGIQEGPLGYNALFSSAVPTNGTVNSVSNLHLIVLGVWDQMLIGDWDLSEIIADNITGAPSATFKIFEHGYYDTNIRHLECFVAGYALAQ